MTRAKRVVRVFAARCDECSWQSEADNALGNAARHHDASGHAVEVHINTTVRYGDADQARRAAGQTTIEEALA